MDVQIFLVELKRRRNLRKTRADQAERNLRRLFHHISELTGEGQLAISWHQSRFDEENFPDLANVLSNCCGLVTVDKDRNIIRLVHFTAQEFLAQNLDRWLLDAKATIEQTCRTFLRFDFDSLDPARTFVRYFLELEN